MQWVKMVGPEQVRYLRAVEVSVIFAEGDDNGIADCWGGLSQVRCIFHRDAEIEISTWLAHKTNNDEFSGCKPLTIRYGTPAQAKERLREQGKRFRDNLAPGWDEILALNFELMEDSINRMALVSPTKDSWILQMWSRHAYGDI